MTQTNVPVIMDSGNYRLINLPLVPRKIADWIVKQASSEHFKTDDHWENNKSSPSTGQEKVYFLFIYVFKWSAWLGPECQK